MDPGSNPREGKTIIEFVCSVKDWNKTKELWLGPNLKRERKKQETKKERNTKQRKKIKKHTKGRNKQAVKCRWKERLKQSSKWKPNNEIFKKKGLTF